MSHLFDLLEHHLEAVGALFRGFRAVGTCIAVAVALSGSMYSGGPDSEAIELERFHGDCHVCEQMPLELRASSD
jgi:hypothetical protein